MSKTGEIIEQRIEEKDAPAPSRVILVVDGSNSMREFIPAIAGTITKAPEQIEFAVLLASDRAPDEVGDEVGDEVIEISHVVTGKREDDSRIAARLLNADYQGGRDNLPALERAWDLAAQRPGSVIIWIHGPNPVLLGKADQLIQRWERRPESPQLYDLQTSNGASRITEKLDGIEAVHTASRTSSPAEDLERLLAGWRPGSKRFSLRREKSRVKPGREIPKTSSHLARLWAFDEVNRIIAANKQNSFTDAVKLAAGYHLVTPVSGAVVLETKEQYENAGLEPVNPATVPTIPEPEEWLLMITAALVMAWVVYRQRWMKWAA